MLCTETSRASSLIGSFAFLLGLQITIALLKIIATDGLQNTNNPVRAQQCEAMPCIAAFEAKVTPNKRTKLQPEPLRKPNLMPEFRKSPAPKPSDLVRNLPASISSGRELRDGYASAASGKSAHAMKQTRASSSFRQCWTKSARACCIQQHVDTRPFLERGSTQESHSYPAIPQTPATACIGTPFRRTWNLQRYAEGD